MKEVNQLKKASHEYWDKFDPSQLDEGISYYIGEKQNKLGNKSLLQAELDFARQKGQLKVQPCQILVLLVGFSLEPLLQSICVYQPTKIVLVLNDFGYNEEEWHVYAKHVFEAINYLVDGQLIKKPQILGEDNMLGYAATDKPEAVFQKLVQILHDANNVVIDITGGKKSMVSGAYLYAAYAGSRISYVDFNEYDPKRRRPYGFTCNIGELANPYETFALRDWERVRMLYERYQFHEAALVLKSLLTTINQVMPDIDKPTNKLISFMNYYELWDRGDYRAAKEASQLLPQFKQPSAVIALGDQWYAICGNNYTDRPMRFYGNLPSLKTYVVDELARIVRLIEINEDYRSAFLRAGSINEIVMLARLVSLVPSLEDKNLLLDGLDKRTPSIKKVYTSLLNPNRCSIDVRKDLNLQLDMIINRPAPMPKWWEVKTKLFKDENGWGDFLNRRNELTHKYFSVPREWADDALAFAQANFEDFLGHPVTDLNFCTQPIEWSDLCKICDLIPYLPPNLR